MDEDNELNDARQKSRFLPHRRANTAERERSELSEALWKKAMGYQATETADEYGMEDGQMVLKKQLVKTKDVPADMTALKMVLKDAAEQYDAMTDEELEAERLRLVGLLDK